MYKSFSLAAVLTVAICLTGCTTRTSENLSSINNWTTQQKTKDLTVGISINPAAADNNSVFISVQNKKGEPISDAKVSITTLKQWMFKRAGELPATCVAAGTYRIDTNMSDGTSELNIAITPKDKPITRLRIEANIDPALVRHAKPF